MQETTDKWRDEEEQHRGGQRGKECQPRKVGGGAEPRDVILAHSLLTVGGAVGPRLMDQQIRSLCSFSFWWCLFASLACVVPLCTGDFCQATNTRSEQQGLLLHPRPQHDRGAVSADEGNPEVGCSKVQ